MPWNIYITDSQNLLPRVSALLVCHHQGVFTSVKVVLFEMVWCMQHSHTIAQILKFQLKQRQNYPQKFCASV